MQTAQTTKRRFLAVLAAAPVALAVPAHAAVPRSHGSASRVGIASLGGDNGAGIADACFAADRADEFRAALGTGAVLSGTPWLALSTGGENGAFGAGILTGWSEAGTRPRFAVVTGISTGALIAPFAFLGPAWDEALGQAYTAVTAADVFEVGATDTSLLDTWPLARLIARFVTPEMLAAIAAEHAAGRRLFVVTTNLDTGRPVAWNMGAIAERGGAVALGLFRDVLLASGSIPGLFPPVALDARGRGAGPLHADGGTVMPFYVAPEAVLTGAEAGLPAREVYVIVNNRLEPDAAPTQRTLISVLGNALSAAVKASTRASLAVHAGFARAQNIRLCVATIDAAFRPPSAAPFDPASMRALYEHARRRGRSGEAFAEPVVRLARYA